MISGAPSTVSSVGSLTVSSVDSASVLAVTPTVVPPGVFTSALQLLAAARLATIEKPTTKAVRRRGVMRMEVSSSIWGYSITHYYAECSPQNTNNQRGPGKGMRSWRLETPALVKV